MSFSILGTGSALPATEKTNDDLAQIMDTSDQWIHSHTGISSRCICQEETITQLAYRAAVLALEDSGCAAEELDYIICATMSGEYQTPALACLVQEKLGARCPAFDINAACTGFLYGLDVAAGFFARKPQGKILVIGADCMSRMVDWQDRSTAVLFGDGAGAVVLGAGNDLLAIKLACQGAIEPLWAAHMTGNCPYQAHPEQDMYLHMDGQEVFRFAVTAMNKMVAAALDEAELTIEDIAYVLPHQANQRILDFAIKRWKIPPEKCLSNINRRGNTSAASVAILLDETNRAGLLHRDDLLVLTAFGAGLTSAACVIRWQGSNK